MSPIWIAMTLLGCEAETLSQAWEIDRTRILAVKAEPAEPTIGDFVTFEALIVHPEFEIEASIWFGCLALEAGSYGCDLEGLDGLDDLESMEELGPEDFAALQEAGLLGVEPYLPPTYQVPEDLLDQLSETEKLEGTNLLLTVSAIPAVEGRELDEELDVELAYKRIPVSLAETPNHNPAISHLAVDEIPMSPGATLQVTRGQEYALTPIFSESEGAGVEDYVYVNSDGVTEARTEEPYFTYYLTEGGGSFEQPFSLYPYGTTWLADTALDALSIWIVVRDRRGGMGWYEQKIEVID